jgi:hypothetical protein
MKMLNKAEVIQNNAKYKLKKNLTQVLHKYR